MTDTLLPLTVLVPLAAGLLGLVLPLRRRTPEVLALGATLATFVLSIVLFVRSPAPAWELSLATGDLGAWLRIRLLVDGLNGWIAIFAALFGVVVALYSVLFMETHARRRAYYASLLLTVGASLGALYSDGVVSFLFFWGLLAVLLYVMVGIDGARAQAAARKSFLIVGGADFLTLLGIVLLVHVTGQGLFSDMASAPLAGVGIGAFIVVLLLIGALAKAGSMPFHTWIPEAADVSPTPVLAFLPASLDKLLGIYLLARVTLHICVLTYPLALLLMIVGGITIVAAVVMALLQKDLKRLLAFCAVSQVGYIVLGIGTGVPIGVAGGLFHMLNHAIYKCCLFLCGGNVEYRAGTTDLDRLGGLSRRMPWTFWATVAAALTMAGIPPLSGFVSKWMIYQGTIESAAWAPYGVTDAAGVANPAWWILLTAAMFGSALTLAVFLKLLYSVFLGTKPEVEADVKEVAWPMAAPVLGLALLCVVFGVFAVVPLEWVRAAMPRGMDLVEPLGLWSPGLGTGLMLLSLLMGALVYWLSRSSTSEEGAIFVGGETLDADETRVASSQLYGPLRRLKALGRLTGRAERGGFDLYQLTGRAGAGFTRVFRRTHTGILTTYLFWVALGMVLLLFALMGG